MDKARYVDKRRRKYLAQTLEAFEELIEAQVDDTAAVQEFKGLVRAKMNALAIDAIDVMNLGADEEINGFALETKDRLHPHGRPHTGSRS